MPPQTIRIGVTIALAIGASTAAAASQPRPHVDLSAFLNRVGERIEQYFARAQRIVCLETVRLQPLGPGLAPQGFGRHVESELRLSWDPSAETSALLEARTLRQPLKINGRAPRRNDPNSCTGPEQNSTEAQPLSMLLPRQQREYTFALAGADRVDRRPAILIDYKEKAKVAVDVQQINGHEDCISFSLTGGMRGRIWIDAVTFDVLRLDQRLSGLIDIPLPRKIVRQSGGPHVWTMERWDSSIRFKAVAFENPDETLVLPTTVSSLRITRGSGTPRLRTVTTYSDHRRFLTSGRIVKE